MVNDILLIEDNPHDVEMIISAFKENHIHVPVRSLKDGAEALDYLFGSDGFARKGPGVFPKVILLDLKLPKVNGLEILKKIRSDEKTRHIPVVILTSSNEEKDRMESYRLGVNSYIVKPVDFESFSNCVAEIGIYWTKLNKPPY